MNEKTGEVTGTLDFNYVLRLCFIFGFALGTVAMPFYAYQYLVNFDLAKFLLVVLFAPFANGIFILVYVLIGYPVYLYLSKRQKFGLHLIKIRTPDCNGRNTMRVETQIKESEQLIQWLDSKIDGLQIPNDDRTRLAAGCLDLALEHQRAIVLLSVHALYGSAFALIRLEVEAYVRGVWLRYSASESEIEQFKKDKLDKTFSQLIEDLEKHDAFNVGVLSRFKANSWTALNSFTHSGLSQVIRRNTAGEIAPNYSDEELVDALNTANSFGILTAIAVADMARSTPLAQAVFERGKKFFES